MQWSVRGGARWTARVARVAATGVIVVAAAAGCSDDTTTVSAGASVSADKMPKPDSSAGTADPADQLVPLLLDADDMGAGHFVVYGPSSASSDTVSRLGDLAPGPMGVTPARCAAPLSDAVLVAPENAATVILRPIAAGGPDVQEVLLSRPEAGVMGALTDLVDSCPEYDVLVDGVPSPASVSEFDVPALGEDSLGVMTTRSSPLDDYSWTSHAATVYVLTGPHLIAVEAKVVRGDTGSAEVTAGDAQEAAISAAERAYDKVAGAT